MTNYFLDFATQVKNILHIKTKSDYQDSLALLEYLFEQATDSEGDPLNMFIEIVAHAIEKYESTQEKIVKFEEQVAKIDPGIAVLRTLIDQFNLTLSDFKVEIGSKSLISMILSGQRNLTKEHIAKLSKRFKIAPSVFF
ncbi:MAG: helix-turn-helix domain-containing protein [Thiomargarita sp.]|nr:helix-turn-helix domain-containing protein [Thiomargarita sp.]